jgi:predicted molibdopterin-dependent oxidoreductase YjgC
MNGKKSQQRPSREVKTICPYCGVGCGIYIGIRDNRIVNVRGDAENPVNKGRLCVKGRFGMEFVHSPDRLTGPLIKKTPKERSAFGGNIPSSSFISHSSFFRESSWDEAIDFVARKLKKYKGEEFALIASTKCTNEDNYIAQKFARVVMGSNNIDTTARLGYGPTLAAFCSIGSCVGFDPRIEDGDMPSDMPQRNIEGVEQASRILVVGADITRTHPVMGMKIRKAVGNGAKLLVISPYENDLCRIAEKRLQPYPGTEPALIMGMCNVIVGQALFDDMFMELYCKNYEEFKASLDEFSIGRVERITGVSRDFIEEAARIYAGGKPAAIFWGKGITQSSHGTDNVYALINLAILTSNIKYPFALNPLTDQNNTLGACDMGCLPDYYPGYQPVGSADAREKFSSLWRSALNPAPGMTLTEILDSVLEGKIMALYIIGSDPASSIAPSKKAHAALKKARFIVFQDVFFNETAKYADVVLPAACFAEKEGTFANMEGKIQRVQRALNPPGHSRPDWEILCDLARGMKCKGFEYGGAGDILDEVSSIVQGIIERTDRFSLFPLQYKPPAETTDIDYPLALTIERDIYDGGVLSEKAKGLMELRTKGIVYINPKDAADSEIGDGEMIRVVSKHGSCEGKALLTGATPPGLAVMNSNGGKTNNLMDPVLDDVSKTPDMKICAVRIEKQKAGKKNRENTLSSVAFDTY